MNKAVLREVWTGRSIDGKFPLIEWIGGSESTAVFRTEVSGGKAAVRLMRADSPAAKAHWEAAELAAGLSHPNLMRVIGSGRVKDKYGDVVYFVTEYADEVLGQIIPERALTADEVKEMLPPVLDALAYLHGRGVVYRQLRPSNIQVVGDRIKLPVDGVVRAGTLETVRPSRIYDAPEIGSLNTSPAADIWSLGATIIEALTQKPLVWNSKANSDPTVAANVPAPFAEIARRCLRSDPARRLNLGQVKGALTGAALPPEPVTPQMKQQAAAPSQPTVPKPAEAVTKPTEVAAKPSQPAASTQTPQKASAPAPAPVAAPASVAAPAAVAAAVSARSAAPVRPVETRESDPEESSSWLANRKLWLVGAVILAVVIVLVLTLGRSHKEAAPSTATQSSSTPSASSPAPAAAPSPAAGASAASPAGGSAQGEVVDRVQPDIPEHAMGTIRGKIEVIAKVHVNENGEVTGASLSHRGSSHYFATRVLDAVRKWKFRAPQRNGKPVQSEWKVEFALRRSGVDATPEQIRP